MLREFQAINPALQDPVATSQPRRPDATTVFAARVNKRNRRAPSPRLPARCAGHVPRTCLAPRCACCAPALRAGARPAPLVAPDCASLRGSVTTVSVPLSPDELVLFPPPSSSESASAPGAAAFPLRRRAAAQSVSSPLRTASCSSLRAQAPAGAR